MADSKYTYYSELPKSYLDQVLLWEGGYVNDPDDSGGETCRGITIGALNTAKKQGLIAQSVTVRSLMTDLESVRKIYSQNYYLKAKCDKLPHPLAFAHLDFAINAGVGGKNKKGKAIGAGANLQKVLIALGSNIALDGSVGPKTLAALDNILTKKTALEITELYNNQREKYYRDLVVSKPTYKKYLNGWLNRLNSARKFCAKNA